MTLNERTWSQIDFFGLGAPRHVAEMENVCHWMWMRTVICVPAGWAQWLAQLLQSPGSLDYWPPYTKKTYKPLTLTHSTTHHVKAKLLLTSSYISGTIWRQPVDDSLIDVVDSRQDCSDDNVYHYLDVGGVAQQSGCRSLAGRLSIPFATLSWQALWVNCLLWVSQLHQLSLRTLR